MSKMLTHEEFLQKLKDKNIKYIPLEEYKGSNVKIKWLCYKNKNHIFEASPSNIFGGKGCSYCSNRKILIGYNDIWTTHPEIASILLNSDDGYRYTANSKNRVDWKCSICGATVKNKIICDISRNGLCCPICSDGISFAEKFVSKLLTLLKCDYIHDTVMEWSNNKRYDFYIPSMNLIIETHGIQHFEHSFDIHGDRNLRDVKYEKENDVYKKNLALNNNIQHYIELDCRYSKYEYIQQSILNSELSVLFDLSNIEWGECYKATTTSAMMICVDLWNSGMKNTKDISDYTKLDKSCVLKYLKRGLEAGLCDFESYRRKRDKSKCRSILCVETNKIYDCIYDVEEDGYRIGTIYDCCGNRRKTAYGLHWQYIN